jgi:hypothetical protein
MTSKLPNIAPPLREAWRMSLDSNSLMWAAPRAREGSVTARCGGMVACLTLTGRIIWQVAVSTDDIENESLMTTDHVVITSSPCNGESTLTALSWADGTEVWRSRLPGHVLREGLVSDGELLYVFTAAEESSHYSIHQLSVLDGELMAEKPAPQGATHGLLRDGRLYFGSKAIWEEDAGLYVLEAEAEATAARKIHDLPVGAICSGESTVITAVESRRNGAYELQAIAAETLEIVWSAPTHEFIVAADGRDVASVEPTSLGYQPVLRDERNGDVSWVSAPLEQEGRRAYFGGDVVCIQHKDGLVILDRGDGAVLDRLESHGWSFSRGAAMRPGRLIIGEACDVICYASTRLEADTGGQS